MTFLIHSLRKGTSHLVRCLSLVLLPALTTEAGSSGFPNRPQGNHRPIQAQPSSPAPAPTSYLAVVGPPPLRFRDAPAPPPYELEPAAAGPALLDNLESVPLPKTSPATSETLPVEPLPNAIEASRHTQHSVDEPAPILPDDLRREVRPEDVIPYFQIPRSRLRVGVPVPTQPGASSLPPSSATYQQQ